ncbi:PQ-loop domain-containing transporter [Mycoplasmopsis alligatoris]|uniref:PQ loop repeat protein n=1 Tax=Mycoplasmopsis alligatoris A21JP2 TaxID=747682 RepID=D4XV79_9BACT|nr:PQ-loop domain-containing transporter [Mycoplasmopsis alligatoris]EFF41751.1 conserved hypothetical protein [Mycoplasmopsis alligatoris A21JP2]
MLNISIEIVSWIATILTIILSIPQLIRVIKDKETKNISFISFWFYRLGMLTWAIYAGLSNSLDPYGLKIIMISSCLSITLNNVLMFYLYFYKKTFSLKIKLIGYVFILLTWLFLIAILIVWLIVPDFRIAPSQTLIFSLIAPAIITFAFLPQLIRSLKTKSWAGFSLVMTILFLVTNLLWSTFWVLQIADRINKNIFYWDIIVALVWQIISIAIYTIQIIKISEWKD